MGTAGGLSVSLLGGLVDSWVDWRERERQREWGELEREWEDWRCHEGVYDLHPIPLHVFQNLGHLLTL